MKISRLPLVMAAVLLSGCSTLGDLAGPAAPDEKAVELYVKAVAGMQRQDKHHAALAYLDELESRQPGEPRTLLMRAESLLSLDRFAEAEAAYRSLLGTPYAAAAHNGMGKVFGAQGRWAEAEAAFGEAVKLRPTHAAYAGNLGYALLQQERLDEAEFRLRQATELDPSAPEPRTNLILCLHRKGDGAAVRSRMATIQQVEERRQIERLLTRWHPDGAAAVTETRL